MIPQSAEKHKRSTRLPSAFGFKKAEDLPLANLPPFHC